MFDLEKASFAENQVFATLVHQSQTGIDSVSVQLIETILDGVDNPNYKLIKVIFDRISESSGEELKLERVQEMLWTWLKTPRGTFFAACALKEMFSVMPSVEEDKQDEKPNWETPSVN